MRCYVCEKGNLKRKTVPFSLYGIELGNFEADVCPSCGEIFFTEESSDAIDEISKKKGLWGLESTTKIGKVGNSLDVKISKDLAEFSGLKKGNEVRVYPESKNRLIIEF